MMLRLWTSIRPGPLFLIGVLILRGGVYQEPTRFEDGRYRDHVTYGLEARMGPFVFTMAQDQAPGFNNSAQGLSMSFKSF